MVREQAKSGIDIVNDGEFGKAMRASIDIGAWWSYVYARLAGFEVKQAALAKARSAWTFGSKERRDFAEFYADEAAWAAAGGQQQRPDVRPSLHAGGEVRRPGDDHA